MLFKGKQNKIKDSDYVKPIPSYNPIKIKIEDTEIVNSVFGEFPYPKFTKETLSHINEALHEYLRHQFRRGYDTNDRYKVVLHSSKMHSIEYQRIITIMTEFGYVSVEYSNSILLAPDNFLIKPKDEEEMYTETMDRAIPDNEENTPPRISTIREMNDIVDALRHSYSHLLGRNNR